MKHSRNLKRTTIIITLGWFLLALGAFSWSVWAEYKHHILTVPKEAARSSFKRNTLLRLWLASHGGLYVPITDITPPNPYMAHVPNRDIETPSGQKLTLMNPAYAIRNFAEFAKDLDTTWHLTSLKLLNPDNVPDEWEKNALHAFEQGIEEVIEYANFEEKPHLRLMKPLQYGERCRKCHGHMGYKLGDVRGGVGSYFSMEGSWQDFREVTMTLLTTYLCTLFAGLGIIALVYLKQKKTYHEQDLLEDKEKRTTEELKKTALEWSTAMDASQDAIYLLDTNRLLLRANKSFYRMINTTPEKVVGKNIETIIHPDGEECPCPVCLAQVEMRDAIIVMEPDDPNNPRNLPIEITVQITKDEANQPLSIFVRVHDLSKQREHEKELISHRDHLEELVNDRTIELNKIHEQLIHAEKLSAIGQLSASIAHEFNNPLQGVMTVIKGVQKRANLEEEDAKLVEMAVKECERMKELIKSLQDFNRPTSGRIAPMDIHATIDSLLLLGKKEYSTKGILVETKYTENMPQILAVADQIKQVLLNILNNASHACREGCSITIRTELANTNEIIIKIHDTGSGINPEDMNHIFDPFFTTKPEIKGTGLGLSISYGIIKRHGGLIEVESAIGQGTTFTVTLPIKGKINAK